ncbi:MAG: hypothetical protein MUE85_10010 [Microscillaceae bacterium]|jgi:hypothetical protein|nr:hypothetical protein [Microscillaceae bacterium]
MDDLFKGLSSGAMLLLVFVWIGVFVVTILLAGGNKKQKKPLKVKDWITLAGLIVVFMGGLIIIFMEIETKKRYENARLQQVLTITRGGKDYIIIISQSITSGKSSSTHWLLYDILVAQTGKRIKREAINLGHSTWDFKLLDNNQQYIFINHNGIKLFDPFGKSEFLTEADLRQSLEQAQPNLKNKIAKVELKTENAGNVIMVTRKTGELQCFSLQNWQALDCQSLSSYAYNPLRKPSRVFIYFNYVAHQWNDSTWLVLGSPDKNNPYKAKLYQHRGNPNGGGIEITMTEGDSTRSLLPNNQPRTKSFPERLELFSNDGFLNSSIEFCLDNRVYLKNIDELGANSQKLLTAYNLLQKKIDWQINIDSLQLSSEKVNYFSTQRIKQAKKLLILPAQPIYWLGTKLVCLDLQTGKLQWTYELMDGI